MQQSSLVDSIDNVILRGLKLALNDIQSDNGQRYYLDATVPCLEKVIDINQLYSKLINHLLNKLLKVINTSMKH